MLHCYTTHLCQPILNQSPKDTPLNFTSLGLRLSSHTSLFWTVPEQLSMLHHAFVPTHLEPTSQDTLQISNFNLTHPFFELCRNNAEKITPRMYANPSWTNVPQTHHKTSDPKIFISHIPLLNFAGAALHITPRMYANPEPMLQNYTNINPKQQQRMFPPRSCAIQNSLNCLTHSCLLFYSFITSTVQIRGNKRDAPTLRK